MALDLTTLARTRAFLKLASSNVEDDALISVLITAWSAAIEQYLDRAVLAASFTEVQDVEPGQRNFWVKNWPVTAITDIRSDRTRAFAASAVVSSTAYVNYGGESGRGRIAFDLYQPIVGPQTLQFNYTAGMAASVGAFVAAYPQLAIACDMQVAWALARKSLVGLQSTSGDGGSVSSFVSDLGRGVAPEKQFIPEIRGVLERYRRVGVGL